MNKLRFFLIFPLFLVFSGIGFGQHDVEWVFDNDSYISYILESFSPVEAQIAPVDAHDPEIKLVLGLRYKVTILRAGAHPFEVIAKGGSASQDTVLLSMASGINPSLESDSGVNWVESGSSVTFTLTQNLLDAMKAGGKSPGYRCRPHASFMRGDFVVAGLPIADPVPGPVDKSDVKVDLLLVAEGLTAPLHLEEAPDGSGRLFIVDQDGQIFIKRPGVSGMEVFLDVSDRLVDLGFFGSKDEDDFDERGLLGMAFHPGFADSESPGFGKLYTYTSEPVDGAADFTVLLNGSVMNHQAVIAEWAVDGSNPDAVDVSTRREILRIDEPQFNHDGGMLAFGPDGYLYISLGDGGGADDTADGHGDIGNGQDINTILGSIVRIDPVDPALTGASLDAVSANGAYRVPTDNPFVGVEGIDEIYAYGFRNPYRFSFDKMTGGLIVGDVGQGFIEEVDIVVNGGNYGWNLKEGAFRFDSDSGTVTDELFGLPEGLLDPVLQFDHDEGLSVIGGYVYYGSELPGLSGYYVFGDFSTEFFAPKGRLFLSDLSTGQFSELFFGEDERPLGLFLKGMGQDLAGDVYVLASSALGPFGSGGVVYKLVEDVCFERLASDLNGDCVTDIEDFALFAAEWLACRHRNVDLCGL